ncbi:hypothetical protein P3S68_023678 [Capsicum galapagoense]
MEDQKVLTAFVGDPVRDSIKQMKDSISKDLAEFRLMLLDVLGKNPTTTFEPPKTVMDAKLGKFCGDNSEAWIVQAEHYFTFYKIKEDQKLTVASFYFDGEALEWYQWLLRNNQLIDWPHFADKNQSQGEYEDTSLQVKTEGNENLLNQAKREIHNSEEIANLDLDDKEEDPLPLDLVVVDTNHASMHFPFDPGDVFVLDGTVEGGKLFNDMSNSKVGVQIGWHQLSQPLPKPPFSALLLDFIAQVDKLVEIAKEFDVDDFVIISGINSKTNGCLFAANFSRNRQLTTPAIAIMLQEWEDLKLRSECFIGNKEKHGCNWLIAVAMERFGGEVAVAMERFGGDGAFKTVHWYLKVDNFSFDGSERVTEYCRYHISSSPRGSFDPNSTLDDILSIPLFNTNAYSLADYVIMSFGREGIDAKKARSDEGIAGHIFTYLCHVSQQLNKNDIATSTII